MHTLIDRSKRTRKLTDKNSLADRTARYLEDSAQTLSAAARELSEQIASVATAIADAFSNNKKIMLCGNGGSAADSQHIATEFVSTLTAGFSRRSLPAMALTTDTSFLTAFANDFDYSDVFSRQVEGHAQPGDILIGLSTSGNSENIYRALTTANELKLTTIGFVGNGGGKIGEVADIAITVPSNVTAHIQEAHLSIGHAVCYAVEDLLFEPNRPEWQ